MVPSRDPFEPYASLGTIRGEGTDYDPGAIPDDNRDVLATPEEPRPTRTLTILALLFALILGWRLIDLQIIDATQSRVMAEGNRVRSREIQAPRGEIHDRNGVVLADNQPSYTLEIYPAELPRKREEWEGILATISSVTGIDIAAARATLAEGGLLSIEPIRLATQIERETALVWQIKLKDLPGVGITKTPQRTYASLPGLGHILGYVGRLSAEDHQRWPELSLTTEVGKGGLELTYEERLRGQPGEKRIEVDARGRIERTLAELPPTQGETLTLTLDARLQEILGRELEAARARREAPAAAAVVLDVHDGGVLALASLPDFDPNIFVQQSRAAERQALLVDDRRPLLNRVTSGSYPSGSTIKPVIATAALSEGTITHRTTLDTSSGAIQIGQWRFPDWKVHGITDVRQAIAESNDIFFYALGGGYQQIPGLGPERLATWLSKFGFGSPTSIDLPGETSGLVPTESWKQKTVGEPWYIGDSYHLAIGQGYFLATPLQLASAVATIAADGKQFVPHLVAGNVRLRSSSVADPKILAIIREGMRQTVTNGTARSLSDLPIAVAGKTGTAQFGSVNTGASPTHSWFVGFAPAENPEIAFAFLVEGGGESSDAAVPAAKEFLRAWAAIRSSGS